MFAFGGFAASGTATVAEPLQGWAKMQLTPVPDVVVGDLRQGGLLSGAAGRLAWTRGRLHLGLWTITLAVNLAILQKYVSR
jgi:hypothetical protein